MEEMQRTDGRWDATQFSCLGESPNFSKEDFRKERERQKKNQEERVYVGEVGAGDVDTAGFLPLMCHPLIHFGSCDEPGLGGSKHCLQEACGLARKKDMLPSNDHKLMKRNYRRAAQTAQVWEKWRLLRPAQGRRWCPGGIRCPASLYPQESSQSPSLPQFAPASQPGCATPATVLLASEFSFPSNPKADAKQNQTEAWGQGHRMSCLKEGCLSGRTEGWWGGGSWGVGAYPLHAPSSQMS